jgi:hypothetical protein
MARDVRQLKSETTNSTPCEPHRLPQVIASRGRLAPWRQGAADRGQRRGSTGAVAQVTHRVERSLLRPLPFALYPVVTSIAALDHLIAPTVAQHNKGRDITATKANGSERNDNEVFKY